MTGIRESAKKGKLRTNGKLYGYAYLKDENRLEIIEKEADVIRTIFQLYHDGMGVRRILSSLKIRGIKTRKGKDFCLNTLLRILNNEKYAGLNNPLKFDNGVVMQKNGYAKIRDGYEKDVKPSDKVPAIIDVDLFNECKALLNSKVSHSSQKGIYKGITKYASMIKCGVCGSTYYRDSDRGRLFYKCSRKKHEGISVCNNLNVKEELIDNFVLMLAQGGITEVINAQKERATKIIFSVIKLKLQKMDKDRDNEAKQIALQIEFKKQELSRYYELYAQATVQNDILKPLIEKTEIVKQELADAYKEAVKSNEQLKIEILDLLNLHNNILKIDAEKAQYTFDETLDMIEFIEIYGKNGKPSIQAYITKAREIENLTARYDLKYETLSLAECREIINQVAELMNTGDQKRDNVS
jgi:hypothetical protein